MCCRWPAPADGDELRLLYRERGWIEAIRHLVENGMLNEEGLDGATKVVAASADWVGTLDADATDIQLQFNQAMK